VLEDSGSYECVAINSAAEARCESRCLVEMREALSLLERAFDTHSDFLVQYRQEDPSGQEVFLHLPSDWDLEAAFVMSVSFLTINKQKYKLFVFYSASNPYICLTIYQIPLEQTVEEWDLINIPVGDYRTVKTKGMRSDPSLQIKFLTKVSIHFLKYSMLTRDL